MHIRTRAAFIVSISRRFLFFIVYHRLVLVQFYKTYIDSTYHISLKLYLEHMDLNISSYILTIVRPSVCLLLLFIWALFYLFVAELRIVFMHFYWSISAGVFPLECFGNKKCNSTIYKQVLFTWSNCRESETLKKVFRLEWRGSNLDVINTHT